MRETIDNLKAEVAKLKMCLSWSNDVNYKLLTDQKKNHVEIIKATCLMQCVNDCTQLSELEKCRIMGWIDRNQRELRAVERDESTSQAMCDELKEKQAITQHAVDLLDKVADQIEALSNEDKARLRESLIHTSKMRKLYEDRN